MRRHLTEAQKATIAVEALPLYEAAARERQGRRTDLDADTNPDFAVNLQQSRAAEEAAAAAGSSAKYVYDAKRMKDDLPFVYELMREGELNIPAAREVEKIPDTETQDTIVDELVAGTLKRHSTLSREEDQSLPEFAPEENQNAHYAGVNDPRARDSVVGASAQNSFYVNVGKTAPPRAANHRKCCRGHSKERARKKMPKTDGLRARRRASQALASPLLPWLCALPCNRHSIGVVSDVLLMEGYIYTVIQV